MITRAWIFFVVVIDRFRMDIVIITVPLFGGSYYNYMQRGGHYKQDSGLSHSCFASTNP
jgi:hypothetical protein